MEKFAVGSIVLVLFPFLNLKGQKVRPAMVLAQVEFNNLVLCQIIFFLLFLLLDREALNEYLLSISRDSGDSATFNTLGFPLH